MSPDRLIRTRLAQEAALGRFGVLQLGGELHCGSAQQWGLAAIVVVCCGPRTKVDVASTASVGLPNMRRANL